MLVLKFGVRKLVAGEVSALAEMRAAHQLYNALVSIERWKRREYAAVRSRYTPGLSEIEAAYEQLSEWIGEHAGQTGKRGGIREKRQRVTAATGVPTKRVDDETERDEIAEMKSWRREASAIAKPLREQFANLVTPADAEYRRRTSAAPKKDNHAKKRLNASAREAMLSESEWHEAWKEVARIEETAYKLRGWVAASHHLNHGTYVAVGDDVARAGKRPPPRPDGEPRKPRQRPAYSSKGLRKMGWQLAPETTWGAVLAGQCRDLRVSGMRPVGGSGRRWRATMAIRISTAERGASEWVTAEVAIHRPVPDDTRIAWAYLVPEERPQQGRWEYSVQLTAEPTAPLITRVSGVGHVEVALRWTQTGDTLDVAGLNGAPLVLPGGPRGIVAQLRFAESVRSAADRYFDEARGALAERLSGMPTEVQAQCLTLPHWRRHEALRKIAVILRPAASESVIASWRLARLKARLDLHTPFAEFAEWCETSGVAEPFLLWLELWRLKDIHLGQMGEGTRRRAMLRRREFYRVTAARLSEHYATCSISGAVDLAALALRDKSEDSPRELHQAARHNRTLASVHEFKDALAHAFGSERFGAAPDAGAARDGEDHAADATSEDAKSAAE
jgi:hypothetical protein